MGMLKDSRGFALGFAVGFGSGLVARDVLPQIRSLASPTLKFILHASIRAGEQSREMLAQWTEFFQDTLAEVQFDLREKRKNLRPKSAAKKAKSKKAAKAGKAASAGGQSNVIPLAERRTQL